MEAEALGQDNMKKTKFPSWDQKLFWSLGFVRFQLLTWKDRDFHLNFSIILRRIGTVDTEGDKTFGLNLAAFLESLAPFLLFFLFS